MTSTLMEAICDPDNIASAVRAVMRNKGAPGVDGITVRHLPGVLEAHWPEDRKSTASGALPAATGTSGASRSRPEGRATSAFQPRLTA